MERSGVARRFPAYLLDRFFTLVIIAAALAIYGAVGGSRLALEAQRVIGVNLSWSSLGSDEVWRSYERRIDEVADSLEERMRNDFTEEELDFIGRTLADSLEEEFVPDRFSLQFFLDLDEAELDRMIDRAFDSVIEAPQSELDPAKVNALRDEAKAIVDEFGITTLVPRAINFAIFLALLPVIVLLAYGFTEALFGRTLGKLLLGVSIRRENGERAFVSHTMLRYAIKNAGLLLLILALLTRIPSLFVVAGTAAVVVAIGSLAAFGPDRRTLHDYLAGTAVYRGASRE